MWWKLFVLGLMWKYGTADFHSPHMDICGTIPAAKSSSTRIINGKLVEEPIPWIVGVDTLIFTCTGGLISPTFVVTAAHCVCDETHYIDCSSKMAGKIKKKVITTGSSPIILKFGSINFNDPKAIKRRAKSIEVPKSIQTEELPEVGGFNPESFRDNDIALIELDRSVKFSRTIGPICLSTPKLTKMLVEKDPKFKMHIAGYGQTRIKDEKFDTCMTLMESPSPYKMCINKCELAKPYPVFEVCQKFMKHVNLEDDVDVAKFWLVNGTDIHCPNSEKSAGKYGWCKTDDFNAIGGEDNKSWGFCSVSCTQDFGLLARNEDLFTAELFKAPCETYVHSGGLVGGKEFCNSARRYSPYTVHIKVSGKKLDNFTISKETRREVIGTGFVDSCGGDSGGPLWSIIKDKDGTERAVMIGAVSRGLTQCGHLDMAAVSSNIASHLDWIKERIFKGAGKGLI